MSLRTLVPSVVAAVLVLAPALAVADDDSDPEVAKLADGGSPRYTVPVPGSPVPAGGSMVLVHAPIGVVRKVVQEYAHYASFLPNFEKSRVVAKKDGKTDVYLQVGLLHGTVTFWSLTRFLPPAKDGPTSEHVAGTKIDGNVDDLRATWRLRAVDDARTVLKLEILVLPQIPVPTSVLTSELQVSADRAVVAARARAEKKVAEKDEKR